MSDTERIRTGVIGNEIWRDISNDMRKIKDYLCGSREDIGEILCKSLKLVLIEISVNKEKYDKYSPVKYSEEDFIDLVIEDIGKQVPDINDIEKNNEYIDDIRKNMWGYIKTKFTLNFNLLEKICKNSEYILSEKECDLIHECLAVVFVEFILRERELEMLENSVL